ncbi:transcriptional regulator [Malikia spinosa]|uniref:Transcriptional regulator n=1 Tax=Malikia spinosa TaxID=86180 RepID=A0A2S9KCC7_9BURK|nr:YafY family protein [Malikia spinosa]PRD68109.1 transcriptional regulator [Malikia spinosa]
MDRTERFYKIDNLLQANKVVPIAQMLRELEISKATFKRDIEYMRDRLHAPIEWDRERGGYRYASTPETGRQALPGLWFNASEAYALLMMQSLLSDMQPGLLRAHIEPLKARLRAVIETGHHTAVDVENRVRLLKVATRTVSDKHFEVVAAALLARERLEIEYYGRARDQSTMREVSPQLLVHYKSNWYLVAWCHLREDVRSFSIDAIKHGKPSAKRAKEIPIAALDEFIGKGYGIFSGENVRWAKLRFSAVQARWVSREQWHPKQRTYPSDDGSLVIEVPFTDVRELSMDILRHGRHVEVLEPPDLRESVRQELTLALASY